MNLHLILSPRIKKIAHPDVLLASHLLQGWQNRFSGSVNVVYASSPIHPVLSRLAQVVPYSFWQQLFPAGAIKNVALQNRSSTNFCLTLNALQRDKTQLFNLQTGSQDSTLLQWKMSVPGVNHQDYIPAFNVSQSIFSDSKQPQQSKPFFCIPINYFNADELRDILKGYSGFTQWQRSKMPVVFNCATTGIIKQVEALIKDYKYRSQVKAFKNGSEDASYEFSNAYAVLLTPLWRGDKWPILSACWQMSIAIINATSKWNYQLAGSDVVENAAMHVKAGALEYRQAMVEIYRNEDLRSELIYRGRQCTSIFGVDQTIGALAKYAHQ